MRLCATVQELILIQPRLLEDKTALIVSYQKFAPTIPSNIFGCVSVASASGPCNCSRPGGKPSSENEVDAGSYSLSLHVLFTVQNPPRGYLIPKCLLVKLLFYALISGVTIDLADTNYTR